MESAPPLPSPSAFPALPLHPHPHSPPSPPSNSDHADTQEQSTPAPATATTLSYARASKSNLPPTTAPEGISLPPQPHKHTTNERPQRVRPEGYASEKPKGPIKPSSSNHPRNRNNHPRRQSNSAPPPPTTTTATTTAKRPRTVPGMPASMLPAPVANKKAKHKSQPPPTNGDDPTAATMIPAVGKKRRQTLRKTLPPTASKLSALAASFDFVPRAGAPSLPAPPILAPSTTKCVSQACLNVKNSLTMWILMGDDENRTAQQQQHDDDTASVPPSSSSNGTLVADDDNGDRQQQQHVDAKVDDKDEKEDGNVDRSAEEAEIPAAQNGNADKDNDNDNDNAAAMIRETVASAGAQGDEFRSESLTTADARGGAVEVTDGTEPGLQSASAKKPVSAGSAPEPERQPTKEEEARDAAVKEELIAAVEEEGSVKKKKEQQRSLAGFLDEAFVAATDGGFAPLDLPVTSNDSVSQEEKGDAMVASSAQQEEVKVTTIPGAVDASPVADLSWREKKGWWSPKTSDQFDDSTAARSASTTPPPPAAAGPAAVEPAQSQGISKDEILLRFPPWKPTTTNNGDDEKKGDQTPVKEMVKPEEVKPLADFLPSAFVAAQPPSNESAASTTPEEEEEEQTVTPKEEEAAAGGVEKKSQQQQQQSGSALSSFLSNSFSATGPPTPLEAPVTITVGEDEDEVPLNAEAIVAEPPLSDILDVDAIGEDGKVVVDQPHAEEKKTAASTTTTTTKEQTEKKEKKKHGWWSPDYVSPEQSATTSSDAHQTGTGLVDDKLVQETVGTAGAQGDEFRAESYSNADRAGVAQLEPASASAQSVPASSASSPSSSKLEQPEEEQENGTAAKESVVEQAEPERSRTPIGQFLGQAFTARSPSESVQEQQRDNEIGTTSGEKDQTSPTSTEASGSSSATSTPRASAVSEMAPTASSSSSSQAPPRRRRSSSSSSSSSPSPPPSPRRTSSHGQDNDDDDDQSPHPHKAADEAPSLTLAIASAWHTAPWSRKIWAVLASVAINVGLPFINGVMLGALRSPIPHDLFLCPPYLES
jgi:hypothetical protein